MNENAIEAMIAKVQLSAKIAQIALACPTCQGPINKAIQEFKNTDIVVAQRDVIKGDRH